MESSSLAGGFRDRRVKSPMKEFLRRYQPVQVRRSRDSYGLGLNQAVTWYPFSDFGLFMGEPTNPVRPRPGAKVPTRPMTSSSRGHRAHP
jgi:hypothetical protein